MATVRVTVSTADAEGRTLIAPVGIGTPHHGPASLSLGDVPFQATHEKHAGQPVVMVPPNSYAGREAVALTYHIGDETSAYPDAIFAPRDTRFTRAAGALVEATGELVAGCESEDDAIDSIVAHTADVFTYGHPPERFYDGCEEIPLLGCGMAEGSCIDINMYLVAALRSAGIEAGYVAGPFFPAEKGGRCDDMHCWVITRAGGVVKEWDIAHHLKLGTKTVAPALNPKPGWRYALSHSMGWDIPALRVRELKLLSEPMWVDGAGAASYTDLTIVSDGAPAAAVA
ncbi:MAG: transglutaminase domain-containing protein [Devosiaceae bacterium]|nr:transglutaminase domain-containing protein [Devosiaceae bacterium MH13]